MSLHIKGRGFVRADIVSAVEFLGNNVTDMANWDGIAMFRNRLDMKRALLAYRAGLSLHAVENMSEEDLTESKLELMAQLRSV